MTVTIHEVLGDLRSTALDTHDQGDKFERLMHSDLRTDREVRRRVVLAHHFRRPFGLVR